MIGRPETPAEEETPPRPMGFDDFELRLGDIMRGERATMGKSLLDVQRELKIKATYIAAIENADPTAFETPGFVAGYVRSYARYLNLDPEWAYKSFCDEGNFVVAHGMSAEASGAKPKPAAAKGKPAATGPRDPFTDPNVSFIPKGEAALSRIEPGAIGSVVVLIGLLAGIGYGGWTVLQEVQKVRFAPVEQAPGVLSDLDPLASSEEIAAAVPSDAGVAPQAPSLEALDRLYRPQALDVPVLVARDAPISTLDPRSVGALASPVPPVQEQVAGRLVPASPEETPDLTPLPVQVTAEDVPEVVLFAVRPSWVRVRAADGTVIFEKILDAGEEFEIPATEEPPTLRAGNAGSVYFAVNGQTFGPAGEGASVVSEVTLAPTALADRFALADPDADIDLARFAAVTEVRDAAPEEPPATE